MDEGKKVFVTGATGFIGSHVCARLLRQGYHVTALVRRKREEPFARLLRVLHRAGLPPDPTLSANHLAVVEGDITRPRFGLSQTIADELAQSTDIIFHCAASVRFENARENELNSCNILGTEHTLDFSKTCSKASLHYMSSAYVSGQRDGVAYEDELLAANAFSNYYEETKYKAERLVRGFSNATGRSTTVYRPSVVIGDSATGESTAFHGFYGLFGMIHAFKDQIHRRVAQQGGLSRLLGISEQNGRLHIPMRICVNPTKTVNLVPIDFVTESVVFILKSSRFWGHTYHIVNPSPPTISDLGSLFSEVLGVNGVEFVDPPSFSGSRPTVLEHLFRNATSRYAFYLHGQEPVFDWRNTAKALEVCGIECPPLNRERLRRMLDYCLAENWGKS